MDDQTSNKTATGSSLHNSLGSFLLFVCFVNPVCAWLLGGGGPPIAPSLSWSRSSGKKLAVAFLIVVGLGSIWQKPSPPNLYAVIGVPRSVVRTAWKTAQRSDVPPNVVAARKEMKLAYRKHLLLTHPDKCVGCGEQELAARTEEMVLLQYAFEVLKSPVLRQAYDIDGFQGLVKRERVAKQWISIEEDFIQSEERDRLILIFIFYASSLAQAYVFTSPLLFRTSPKGREKTRSYLYSGLVAALIFDAMLCFTSISDRGGKLLPFVTPFMKVEFLRGLVPTLFTASRIVADANAKEEASADEQRFTNLHAHIDQQGAAIAALNQKMSILLKKQRRSEWRRVKEVPAAAGAGALEEGMAVEETAEEEEEEEELAPLKVRIADGSIRTIFVPLSKLAVTPPTGGSEENATPPPPAVPAGPPAGVVRAFFNAVPRSVWVFVVVGAMQHYFR